MPDRNVMNDILMEPGFYACDLFDCPPFEMFHANDCPRAVDILRDRSFEPMSLKIWCALVRDANAVFDVGAHVGVYSLAAAALRPDVPIHAYEPNPDVFARLALHVRINGFANITAHRTAIANQTGVATITWVNKGPGYLASGAQLIDHGAKHNRALAYTQPLDLPDSHPMALKIDVEGAEHLVFEKLDLKSRSDIILETFSTDNARQITGATRDLGYKYYLIDEQNMSVTPTDALRACDPKGRNFNQLLTTRRDVAEKFC
jgi:FkbM family methyltransferase